MKLKQKVVMMVTDLQNGEYFIDSNGTLCQIAQDYELSCARVIQFGAESGKPFISALNADEVIVHRVVGKEELLI